MTLAFVVPGLDEAASEKAIAILQNRLSQEQEAALVLKHAHWNVTGPNFIAVHEMLDPGVEAVLAQADETAERIATLGGTPDGRAAVSYTHLDVYKRQVQRLCRNFSPSVSFADSSLIRGSKNYLFSTNHSWPTRSRLGSMVSSPGVQLAGQTWSPCA